MAPVTVSMTRANKLLAKLRELGKGAPETTSSLRNRAYGFPSSCENTSHGVEVSYLTYNADKMNAQLAEIRKDFDERVAIKALTEKWKCTLFQLNIKYGIHDLLAEIDLLKMERSMLNDILRSNKTHRYQSEAAVIESHASVADYEKRWDMKWSVGAFDSDAVKANIREISCRLSTLDNKKDKLNIENSFTIDLTDDQRHLLNIEA